MNNKPLIWIGLFVGSTIGGFVPMFWHESLLSLSSVVCSGVGGLLGIWAGYKIGQRFI
jgi:hypothetical protein